MRVCVLGAGIAGLMTAYYLAMRGHQITLIDRQRGPALETSKANAGLLTPSQALPWNEPGIVGQGLKFLLEESAALVIHPRLDPSMWAWLARFAAYSGAATHRRHALASLSLAQLTLTEVDQIAERHGIAFDRTQRGILTLVKSEANLPSARRSMERIKSIGVECRLIGRSEALAMEPALEPIADRFHAALLTPNDGSGDSRGFCAGISSLLKSYGVNFRFGESVERLKPMGQEIAAAVLTTDEVEADAFVLALGNASRRIAKSVGVSLKLYPVQGCSITMRTIGWNRPPTMPVRDPSLRVAITPLGDRIRVAGMAILNGGSLDIADRHRATLRRALAEVFPTLPLDDEGDTWSGLRPMTPDGPPFVGPTPYRNLWLNTGHGPLGWTMGCGSAKATAALIEGAPSPVPVEPLRYDRYRL